MKIPKTWQKPGKRHRRYNAIYRRKVKLERAQGGCLGTKSRRKT